MTRRVAVITDATSAGYFFPHWVRYYGGLFGRENLMVLTYEGMRQQFQSSGLKHVVEIPSMYSDEARRVLINSLCHRLIQQYEYVVRCDVDEFLVPDPHVYHDLVDYIERLDIPYVTALGLDVVEMGRDPELRLDCPGLLSQRNFVVKAASYSKTCITNRAINWSHGFHYADVIPAFNNLYNFHMKFSDVRSRVVWLKRMAACCASGSGQQEHFLNAINEFQRTYLLFQSFEIRTGWEAIRDKGYQKRIEASLKYPSEADPFFTYMGGTEQTLSEIPRDFQKAF